VLKQTTRPQRPGGPEEVEEVGTTDNGTICVPNRMISTPSCDETLLALGDGAGSEDQEMDQEDNQEDMRRRSGGSSCRPALICSPFLRASHRSQGPLRVLGFGFWVLGLGSGVWDFGLGVMGLGFWVRGFRSWAQEFRV